MSVVATIVAPEQPINSKQVSMVQSFLSKEIGKPMEFKLRIIPAKEISAVEIPPLTSAQIVAPKLLNNPQTISVFKSDEDASNEASSAPNNNFEDKRTDTASE